MPPAGFWTKRRSTMKRSDAAITEDGFLGNRIRLRQPADGYRAAIDPVLLAAAVSVSNGDSVLDAGAGTGAAAVCLAARVPSFRIAALEIQPALAGLARENAAINGFEDRLTVHQGDVMETGTLFPVEEMAMLAKSAGVMFHTDAVQAVGKLPISLKDGAIDMLSLSGHKLHAPKGIGVLYLRRNTRFRPLLRGGHQERGRRAGTENTASIVALGKACEMALEHMDYEKTFVRTLRDRLEQGILAAVPNCFVTGDPGNRLPNTANIAFEYIEGEAILLLLNKLGIAASSGSACTSGSLEPSHVMRAMGIPFTAAHGTVRFSLSRYNSMQEIERVIEAVPPIVAQLRKLSPYWGEDGPSESPEKAFAPAFA